MYQDIKINKFKLRDNVKDSFDSETDFNDIDNYKSDIEKYIFTDIQMIDGFDGIEKAFQSRLQILLSSVLLRSLLLKEGAVIALNNSNFPAYYAVLKSFLEIPALLGYVVHLIYNNDYEKIIPKINDLCLGNKEAGSLFVGRTEAVNILTMFDKLGRVLKDIATEGEDEEAKKKILSSEDVLTSMYKDVCNFAHINYNAHLSIGILDHKNGKWRAKQEASGYKEELYAFYMPSFNTAIDVIKLLCGFIMKNKKVKRFALMSNKKYFR
ncbi:MAG: hypothetical protein HQ537_01800 [Parcubacteria group bacterium]|nr:hypothetical protein [Parcubacteria group bacterium]